MKYSHHSKHRKSCAHDPDYRAQLGFRLRTARCNMGWSIADAAKYFHVTERTWHNWENGSHRIPFAVYKLCRVLARLELPSEAWAGWSFQGAVLITPEGRQIHPKDGSWWSLMVRNAQSFTLAYNEATRLRLLLADLSGVPRSSTGCASAPESAEGAGLVPFKTNRKTVSFSTPNRLQNDVIIESWPILCDSQTPLTPLHAPKPTISESPLTPSFALPWTPICGLQWSNQPRPKPGPHRLQAHLQQSSSPSNLSHQNPPPSSPEPRSKPSMNGKKQSVNAYSASAKPAQAAKTAQQASATRGQP
jgi:DNA-binding transcriptional regulator YiaG